MSGQMQKPLVSVEDAAILLEVSRSSLYRAIQRGRRSGAGDSDKWALVHSASSRRAPRRGLSSSALPV